MTPHLRLKLQETFAALLLNIYGGTNKYFERLSFSRDQSSSDRSCSYSSSTGNIGLFRVIEVFERSKFE